MLVINKSVGITTYPKIGIYSNTLINFLIYFFPKMQFIDSIKMGLVHRLDRDTSGLIVCVKNIKASYFFNKEFKNRRVIKTYLSFCLGFFGYFNKGIITGYKRCYKNRVKYISNFKIKELSDSVIKLAHSRVSVIGSKRGVSLLNVYLITGRTHQIRVHLSNINKPVLQDIFYGSRIVLKKKYKDIWLLDRYALHSNILEFFHLKSGELIFLKVKMPDDLYIFFLRLKFWIKKGLTV